MDLMVIILYSDEFVIDVETGIVTNKKFRASSKIYNIVMIT
jgi:hypothetical protein